MHILNFVIDVIRRPFPKGKNRLWYYRSLGTLSLFVFIFIYIFKPFGLHQLKSNNLLICIGFGAMTFLGATLYELILNRIRYLIKVEKPYTFGKWLTNYLGAMFCISVVNFLFARIVFFGYIEWSLYPKMLYATVMIGIIPLTFIGTFSLISKEKKNKAINIQGNSLNTKKEFLYDIPISQIKYIEALQNYVKIAYITNDGTLKIQIQRVTLKEIQSKVNSDFIVKCHRSYLVNVNAITNTVGNSQGLSLTLSDCKATIPVSRTWVPVFRKN